MPGIVNMMRPRRRGHGLTIGQIVSAHKGGRHLAEIGVIGAQEVRSQRGGLIAITETGEIHSDRLPARSFDALAALAKMCDGKRDPF